MGANLHVKLSLEVIVQAGRNSCDVERSETPGVVRLSVRDTGGEAPETGVMGDEALPGTMAREAVLAVAQ
ncbi:MAG: hypothetical protein N3D16_08235, partial [Anaerolineales bacterium]|nr:hypothetical protein [Anaerolineales bacterium]